MGAAKLSAKHLVKQTINDSFLSKTKFTNTKHSTIEEIEVRFDI